jgi:ribose transport system ATP-binding protein
MLEIAKVLMTNAEVIIMDEPTAALTERETCC